MKKKVLDSNNTKTDIHNVCYECGIAASELTYKKKFPEREPPERYCFLISTYHSGKCDYCQQEKSVTQTRDFFYPDFGLLKKAQKAFYKWKDTKKKNKKLEKILFDKD